MDYSFLATIGVASVFFLCSFIWLDEDLNKKEPSLRPVFLYGIAAFCYFISLPAITAPSYTTMVISPYNITSASGSILAHYPTITQTISENTPSPTFQFYLYMTFSLSMFSLSMILLFLYMIERGNRMVQKTAKGLEK